jgi:hypothetical protein
MRLMGIVVSSLCLAWSHGGSLQAANGEDPVAMVRLSLDDQANRLWKDLPEEPAADGSRNVTLLGGTSPSCAGEAMRRTRAALQRAAIGRAAVRSLAMSVGLDRAMLREQRIASVGELAELFDQYLGSSDEEDFIRRTGAAVPARASLYRHFLSSRSDQVLLASPDASCGVVNLLFEIRSFANQPGRLHAWFVADGHCACRAPATPGAKLGRFRVAGRARMEPGDRSFEGRQAEVKWKLEEPRYAVLAVCGPCARDEQEAGTRVPAASGACGRCDPLRDAAKGWEQEAVRADAAAATASLERRTTAAATLQQRAAAARDAAAEARDAAGRCGESCPAPPPVVAGGDRQAPSGGATKKILIGGGAAVAVAGGVIALGGGSTSDASSTSSREPTPQATPTPRPEPTPTPDPTPTPRPTPTPTPTPTPPPATCPDVFGSYSGRGVLRRDDGCRLSSAISVTIRISGTCGAMGLDIVEPQGTHSYGGQVGTDGSFSAAGGGTLSGGRGFAGTLTGQVSGRSLSVDETLRFTSGCAGLVAVYAHTGTR